MKAKVLVEHVAAVGYPRSAKVVEDGVHTAETLWEVKWLANPTHLGRSQFKICYCARLLMSYLHSRQQKSGGLFKQFSDIVNMKEE